MTRQANRDEALAFGATVVVAQRRELSRNGVRIEVGERAFDLLMALVDARGTVLSKQCLKAVVWPGRIVEDNTLEGQMSVLRRALGEDRAAIRTVSGRGYQFVGELLDARGAPSDRQESQAGYGGVRLPAPVTPLVGRATALHEVASLARSRRLLTLVGAGGVGKTRLAVEAGRRLQHEFAGEVYLAELAAIASAQYIPGTVAVALGYPPGEGTPSFDKIAPSIRDRRFVLVLDNCEHLMEDAARTVDALLRAAPSATVIATSREPLRLQGECVYRVPSLDVPPADDAQDATSFGAIQLFEQRLRDSVRACTPDLRDVALKVRICRHLDGIPLAIELAAACVPTLGLHGVADRLNNRFQILRRGARAALPRQQTLQATLDWSYDLLSGAQAAVLNRLSVFAGSFTIESAQIMASGGETGSAAVLLAMMDLVDKSLVTTVPDSTPLRYRLLETTREYAREKLRRSGLARDWAARHARYFLGIFSTVEAAAEAHETIDWDAAVPHVEDLRAAIEWAFSEDGDEEIAIDLTIASVALSMRLGVLEECLSRVNLALACLERRGTLQGQRAMRLHAARGACLLCQTASPETGVAFKSTIEFAGRENVIEFQLRGLWGYWNYAYLNGVFHELRGVADRFARVAALSDARSDELVGRRLKGLTALLHGELPQALDHFEQIVAPAAVMPFNRRVRFLYDERMLANASLSHTLWFLGRPQEATQAARASLADARELGQAQSLCYALSEAVCTVALVNGDDDTLGSAVAQMIQTAKQSGVSTWKARAKMWAALIQLMSGNLQAYDDVIKPGFVAIGAKRFFVSLTPFLTTVALLLGARGRTGEAMGLIEPAADRAIATHDICSIPELLRTRAEIMLLCEDDARRSAAEAVLLEALEQARKYGLFAWELRVAISLAKLWIGTGRARKAHDLVRQACARFSGHAQSADLTAAREMVSLSAMRRA